MLQQFLRVNIQDTLPNSQTTYRSALLTSLQPLVQFKVFLNPVIEDFPDLKTSYLEVIKEPMSISQIKYKLNARTCKYSIVYEALRDVCLITHNCRTFSPANEYLLTQCTEFEASALQCINTFLLKINCKPVNAYSELASACLKPLDDSAGQNANDAQQAQPEQQMSKPTQADVDDCAMKLLGLEKEKQHELIQTLLFELDNIDFSDQQTAVLKFDLERDPGTFWWFYQTVQREASRAGQEAAEEEEEQ